MMFARRSLFWFWIWCLRTATGCTNVANWNDLKAQIEGSTNSTEIIVCPGRISKPKDDFIIVDKPLILRCSRARRCIIRGEGIHLVITGPEAEAHVEGFVFRGATQSAVQITGSTQQLHVFKKCIFRGNGKATDSWRGGAIRTGRGSRITIKACRFIRNGANSGAAIFHRGVELWVSKSVFKENRMHSGGVIELSEDSHGDIETSKFIRNAATNFARGGNVAIANIGDMTFDDTLSGTDNMGCNGMLVTRQGQCFTFEEIPFQLGELSGLQDGIRVSQGLSLEIIARTNETVPFTSPEASNTESVIPFHMEPDGATVFSLNDGGFTYVSNAEVRNGLGGVYAAEFDRAGLIRGYKQLLKNTTRNCSGGQSPWNTWVSCEEQAPFGQCWQVDPFEHLSPRRITMSLGGGAFEAFAYDHRGTEASFFVTEDAERGALRRFRSNETWGPDVLHDENGIVDFLEILPGNEFRWNESLEVGRQSAFDYFQNSEGVVAGNGVLWFVSKKQKEVFRLDLDSKSYTVHSTHTEVLPGGGSFDAQPDILVEDFDNGLLYFTEDGGKSPGIFVSSLNASSYSNDYVALLEAEPGAYLYDEITGVAFSPDAMMGFFCLQEAGLFMKFRRLDGKPFTSRRLLGWKRAFR